MTLPACVLCGAPAPLRFRVRGHAVHRCDRCDLEFVWPTPDPATVRAVYAQGYFTGAQGAGYDDYFGRERDIARRKADTRLAALRSLGFHGGRLLDVGCAAGYFVEAAAAAGWDAYGVEPSPEAREGASSAVASRVFETLDASLARGPFDAVTLWDVLEHLPDPLATLRALRGAMREGAALGVVVPVLGSVNTRVAPRTWDQYKPPEHLWYWSPAAMRATLARGAGARVLREDVAWTRPSRFIDPGAASRSLPVRLGRAIDAGVHRVLSVFSPALVVDSVAFYAVCEAPR